MKPGTTLLMYSIPVAHPMSTTIPLHVTTVPQSVAQSLDI
jgi:hypothetical protein